MAFSLHSLFSGKLGEIEKLIGKVKSLIQSVGDFFSGLVGLFGNATTLFGLVLSEINEWRRFRESIPYRTGVINIPKAIEQTAAFIDELKSAWSAILDTGQELKKLAPRFLKAAAAEATEAAVELAIPIIGEVAMVVEILPTLIIVVEIIKTVEALMSDLLTIANTLKDIREEIEHGSTVFLQQKNPRKNLKLADGGNIRIRVSSTGGMHDS